MLTGALVSRVLTTKQASGLAATAVEFEHDGRTYTVAVSKDAILSARFVLHSFDSTYEVLMSNVCYSTVKSPHILELSGIGNRKVLDPLGIPVQLDLPSVGENLQDHLIHCGLVYSAYFFSFLCARLH